MVEYFAYNEEVNGSSPLLPIINQGARYLLRLMP